MREKVFLQHPQQEGEKCQKKVQGKKAAAAIRLIEFFHFLPGAQNLLLKLFFSFFVVHLPLGNF